MIRIAAATSIDSTFPVERKVELAAWKTITRPMRPTSAAQSAQKLGFRIWLRRAAGRRGVAVVVVVIGFASLGSLQQVGERVAERGVRLREGGDRLVGVRCGDQLDRGLHVGGEG